MTITISHPIQHTPPVDGFVQRIYAGFLSRTAGETAADTAATGELTSVAAADLVDGETFTLDDGVNTPTVFEFDVSADGVGGGNVAILAAGTATNVRDLTRIAINGVGPLNITASDSGVDGLSLVNDATGETGNTSSSETVANAGFVITDIVGGYSTVLKDPETLEFTANYNWDNNQVANPELVRIVPQFRFSAAMHHVGLSLIDGSWGLLTRRAIRFY